MAVDLEFPHSDSSEDVEMSNKDSSDTNPSQQAITLPAHVCEKIYASWRSSSIIVKVVGKYFGYKSLHAHLTGIWKLKGNISMIDLGYKFFLIKFSQTSDYRKL